MKARHRKLPFSGLIDCFQPALKADGTTEPYAWVEWTHKRGQPIPEELKAGLPAFVAVAELEVSR